MIIEYGMYLRCLAALVGSKQVKRSDPPCRKQGWIAWKIIYSEKLSFVHKRETEHSFELPLSICIFYRRIFNLEMQMVDMTIGRLWGSGVWVIFTDLVCIGRIFSQTSLELEIFSLTYNGVRIFSALYVMSVFFSAGYFSPRNLFAYVFPLEISLHDVCLKSSITLSKVKWLAPKFHKLKHFVS